MKINKYVKRLLYGLTVVIVMLCFGCGKDQEVRKYKRDDAAKPVVIKAHAQMQQAAPAYSWDTPQGWQEEKNTSGFRAAAFSIEKGQEKSTCTVIPLKGAAGGLKANVARWMSQVDIAMEESQLDAFLGGTEKFETKGGLPVVFIDLTTVTTKPEDASILTAVITLQERDTTVFIKMTGKKSHLLENKEKFKALSRSFKINTDTGQ